MRVGLILWLVGVFVAESGEGFCHITYHRQVHFAVVLVPIEIQTEVFYALPIAIYFVVLLKHCHEVLRMLFYDIFYAKIIDS